jgi:hypothetical protein
MNPIRLLLPLCLAVGLFGQAGPVRATSLVPMELPELVTSSEVIVHGEVVGVGARWNEDHSLILTDVRVHVLDVVKGGSPREIVLTQPGGTIGKLRVEVPGARAFRTGEEVVVFLTPGPRGDLFVTGLSQGRFEVVRDAATGRKTVRGPIFDRAASGDPGLAPSASAGGIAERSLTRFLGRVRRLVDGVVNEGGK